MKRIFNCIFCGNNEFEIVKIHTRDSDHKVVQCKGCGLQQLFPIPSAEEDAEYYDGNNHDRNLTPEFSIDDIYQKFEYQNLTRIEYLEKYGIRKDWKMLDYASGYGFFMQMMEERGYWFDGIEISEERLRICKGRTPEIYAKVKKINLLMEEIPQEMREYYDLVTMFHLLEHISEPLQFLKKVYEIIKPGGVLVAELPNVANIMMQVSPEFSDFFYIRDHVAYYTPEQVKKLIAAAGFNTVMVKGNQIYGIQNHMNWILNKGPQLKKPDYQACKEMEWIENIYKTKLNETVRSEYMYVIAQR